MKEKKSKSGLLILMILIVVVIWILSSFLIIFGLDNWSDRGTFGDLFGAVNALFSGLAFAGLIYTIVLQKQDLELQRKEIALNRTELKKTSKAQQHSEKALIEQVEQMKIASKLNALKTLIDYYNIQISNPNNSEEIIAKAKEKRKATIQEIDLLIDRIGDDELE
jgi:flagellar biosynthesis component FlhA